MEWINIKDKLPEFHETEDCIQYHVITDKLLFRISNKFTDFKIKEVWMGYIESEIDNHEVVIDNDGDCDIMEIIINEDTLVFNDMELNLYDQLSYGGSGYNTSVIKLKMEDAFTKIEWIKVPE